MTEKLQSSKTIDAASINHPVFNVFFGERKTIKALSKFRRLFNKDFRENQDSFVDPLIHDALAVSFEKFLLLHD
ncbi:hypothetical protein ACTXT7_012607 [Hymenolepis weldensis]